MTVHRLTPEDETSWKRLGIRDAINALVRADGHIAYRSDTADTAGPVSYWLPKEAS